LGAIWYFTLRADLIILAAMARALCVSGIQEECLVTTRIAGLCAAVLVPITLALAPVASGAESPSQQLLENGIVRVKSGYSLGKTIDRIRQDVTSKGIMFFFAVDQSKLAADAGINLRPSTLLVFGNPALGSQFMTSNPLAGIDWPVRLLVVEDEQGDVWAVYNDFAYLARRHGITDRDAAFQKASEVIASVTSSVAK
jgi:uncharacterized protein (DUF302 family)